MSFHFWTQFHLREHTTFPCEFLTINARSIGTFSEQPVRLSALTPTAPQWFVQLKLGIQPVGLPAMPKAETILKSDPYFHQNQFSDAFKFPFSECVCNILDALSEIRVILSFTDALYLSNLSTQMAHTEYLPCVRNKCRQTATSVEGSKRYSLCFPCLAEHLADEKRPRKVLLSKKGSFH